MLLAALLLVFIIVMVFVLALCKAAGKADRWEEKWTEQRKKEEQAGYVWCDDECLHCHQNDWCKFSEVKHDK